MADPRQKGMNHPRGNEAVIDQNIFASAYFGRVSWMSPFLAPPFLALGFLFFFKVLKMPNLRFLVLLPILAVVGCANSWPSSIKIVIPSTFRGEFWIIESQDGLELLQEEGEYRITIPQNGQLFVKSLDCFINSHTETISDDKGNVLRYYIHSSRAADNVFGVYGGSLELDGIAKRKQLYYFVGTAKEASKKMRY